MFPRRRPWRSLFGTRSSLPFLDDPSLTTALQKLIKELPSLVPADEAGHRGRADSAESSDDNEDSSTKQQHGDRTTEHGKQEVSHSREELGKSTGEVAFFKLLHAEFKKATFFFDKAQKEFIIREERVREGIIIMKKPNSIMVNEKWSLLAKSIFRLYKDLLLFETFAIMTYCSFSKILKKHDKVTGHHTRRAFMANVVSKANFTNYPKVLDMISRCEQLYEEVSERLVQDGKECLYEDERLFINMISRLNEQVLDTEERESGTARAGSPTIRKPMEVPAPRPMGNSIAMSTLRSMVEENDALAKAAHIADGSVDGDRKRSMADTKPAAKKNRTSA